MKALILTLAVAFSASSFAFGNIANVPGPIPTDNTWSLGKVSRACGLNFEQLVDNYVGAKQKAEGQGWYYYALDASGEVVYKSYSSSRFVWGTNECMTN